MSLFELITLILAILAIIISILSARYARKQYLTGIKPELWHNNTFIADPSTKQVTVTFGINNRGQTACITKIKVMSKNLVQKFDSCPFYIKTNESVDLNFIYVGTDDFRTDPYRIKIYYSDKDKNSYSAVLKQVNHKYFIV